MKNRSLILATTLLLTGCVTFGQMDNGLDSLVGKNKDVAFRVLGYPGQVQDFDGDKVYTWANSTSGVAMYSAPQTTYGNVGGTSFYGTTTQTNAVPVEYSCKIQIITGGDGVIKDYNYDGSIGGCESYIHRLNNYAKKG
ncbi:hypothetical protein [Serratia rubidaea]|uniref:hypothetical protein n=1 Tax=Serratia rubidaea TaxID=61652 RepID=UPI001E2C6EE7|nr:hypothetical protein [Serratia rubidaea]